MIPTVAFHATRVITDDPRRRAKVASERGHTMTFDADGEFRRFMYFRAHNKPGVAHWTGSIDGGAPSLNRSRVAKRTNGPKTIAHVGLILE